MQYRLFMGITLRWPSVPYFPGHYWFLITCPRKNHSSPGTPICLVFCSMSLICTDLPISAAIWLCVSGQKLAQISSVYMKKSLAVGAPPQGSAPDPTGGAHDAPHAPKSDPPIVRTCGARIHLALVPVLRCQNYGHLILHPHAVLVIRGRNTFLHKWIFVMAKSRI